MGGESSSSHSMAISARGETHLFRSRSAQLFLIDSDESVLMQSGDFAFSLVKHSRSPLAAVVAMVGDVQWPVGKDYTVTNMGEASFCFCLPGPLLYGLVLANTTAAADLQRLEGLLEEYSAYQTATHYTGEQQGQAERQAAEYWTKIAPEIEGGSAVRAAAAVAVGEAAFQNKRSRDEVSARMVSRMQQARRLSAVAKLFSKSLERGVINASTHIETVIAASAGSPSSAADLALASVDAVAKVVEAVETAGRGLLESAGTAGSEWVQRNYGKERGETAAEGLRAVGSFINSAWTLNKVGLRMLFGAIAAINSGGNRRSTSSSDIPRLLSTSSSSSSFSSKSPATPSHIRRAAESTSRLHVTARPPPPPRPPTPPLTSSAVPFRQSMPPPPPPTQPAPSTPAAGSASGSLRLYKPRPASAVPATLPPPFLPRSPPRPHPPS